MTVSQVALGVMLLSCFLSGVILAPVYDMLLIPRTLLCGTWLPWVVNLRDRLSLPGALQPWRILKRHKRQRQQTCNKNSKWCTVMLFSLTAAADFLFLVVAAVVFLLLLYATNDGAFRISAAVSMVMGILLGRMTLARWMTLIAQILYNVLRAGLIFSLSVITYPITAFTVFLWKRSAPMRQRLFDAYRKKKQEIIQRKQAKRTMAAMPSEETHTEAQRPKPDGRRVFCAGRAK